MTGGYGSGPWGSGPWGGAGSADTSLPTEAPFDIFNIGPGDVGDLEGFDGVTLSGPGGSFSSGPGFFGLCSGDGVTPTANASLSFDVAVNNSFTLDWHVNFDAIPDDFSDLVNKHIYIGAFSTNSSAAGLFISQDGLQYTGSVAFSGGDLVVASPVIPIPGSAAYIQTGVDLVIRIIANAVNSTALIYVTPEADLPSTGHQLVAILPLFSYTSASPPPSQDQVLLSVRHNPALPGSCYTFSEIKFSSKALVSNVTPVADAGDDLAVRTCSIVRLDGSRSFDPEGEELTYEWRLIDAPVTSSYVFNGNDGLSVAEAPPTGFTLNFRSPSMGVEHATNPFSVGDVLVVRGVAYTISVISPGSPFQVSVEKSQIPDDAVNEPFKIIRQGAISEKNTVNPTFLPDVTGFYVFDLMVNDGELNSSPTGLDRDTVLVNVVESSRPRGVNPNASFVFTYLSSFWQLLEDKEVVSEYWSALAQVAATELYTLWQLEYSKSLRDIQRTFIRRWLHYDLMLPEPVPDLTAVKTIWGGVVSSPLPAAGVAGVAGKQLIVSTSLMTDSVTLTFNNAGTVPIDQLAGTLQNKLRTIDKEFRVDIIENRSTGDFHLRVYLPRPFTLMTGSDLPIVLSYPQFNDNPRGTGTKINTRTIDVGFSLTSLGIEEDDILVVDRVGYRVVQLIDNEADDFPFQRVLVKEDIPDGAIVWTLPGWVLSQLLDFYNGLVDYGDVVEFEVLEDDPATPAVEQVSSLIETTALGVTFGLPGRLAIDTRTLEQLIPIGVTSLCLARVVRRHYVPIDETIVSVPALTAKIVVSDDAETLRENGDYILTAFRGGAAIKFQAGASGELGDVWEGARPPDRLWAEYSFVDNRALIEANFGIPIGLLRDDLAALPDSVDYLSAVRGMYYVLYNGPKVRNVRIGVQILLGLPFAEAAGTIAEIRDDFILSRGRILVRDAENTALVRAYDYPNILELETNPATGERYKVGDTVEEFAPLVEGAEVIDYVNNPTWFENILNQGIFYEVQKYHTFLVRIDSAAFSLESLSLVRRFVNGAKDVYKNALFFTTFRANDTAGDEIDVVDTLKYTVTLNLAEQPCHPYGPLIYDAPDSSDDGPSGQMSGAWLNGFDTDSDDLTAPPVFPTPDGNITWGFDKEWLCPEDELVAKNHLDQPSATADITNVSSTEADFVLGSGSWETDYGIELGDIIEVTTGSNAGWRFQITSISGLPLTIRGTIVVGAGPPVTEAAQTIIFCPVFDGPFVFDQDLQEDLVYDIFTPASVPLAGLSLGTDNVAFTGTLEKMTVAFLGDPDVDPTDYKIEVLKNSVLQTTINFTDGVNTEVVATLSVATTGGDTIELLVKPASGGVDRAPNWSRVVASVYNSSGPWAFDVPIAPGQYVSEATLSG